ncbi:hypothetical protein POPTR_005G165100v4 [Populus trichocarpa]|uniref:Secreted protein n=1 Tax=Populus trichocarpa TaxID=3694 RepID=B9H734_POPTR|nr:hypothetical protein BDE02_05G137300 [Populus trichocarpa]PNT37044.1 hypothetical protein POPTR_005G165100v4 [Populus trichocarpa]
MWTCLLFRIFRWRTTPMVALGTFPIEKKSTRIEISLYCLARAIENFFNYMVDAGHLPQSNNLKRPDVVVFSASRHL